MVESQTFGYPNTLHSNSFSFWLNIPDTKLSIDEVFLLSECVSQTTNQAYQIQGNRKVDWIPPFRPYHCKMAKERNQVRSTEQISLTKTLVPPRSNQSESSLIRLQQRFGIKEEELVKLNPKKDLTPEVLHKFLVWLLASWKLTIDDYFEQMEQPDSFFLIASTGLGKTVGTPLYLLLKAWLQFARINQKPPIIWVVVPTIAIVQESHQGLSRMFGEFWQSLDLDGDCPVLYGARSSIYIADLEAPIQFITTGILPLLAASGELQPHRDVVLIDEAHKTLTQDESMELALSALWEQQILVHFMSATVGTEGLETRLRTKIINAVETRFPIFWHNSGQDLETTTLEAIRDLLITHDPTSAYFPPPEHPDYFAILDGVDPKGERASGILVVVDSFNGQASQAKVLREAILPLCQANNIAVLGFASSVRDDDVANHRYQAELDAVLATHGKYVIIATNVIEMGVTWPTLDMVITGDTEIVNQMVAGQLIPLKQPIGTAAIKQRGGRIGRTRPGLVAIATSGVNPISELSDQDLVEFGLKPVNLVFPLQKYTPAKLTYQMALGGITTISQAGRYLRSRNYPSIAKTSELTYTLNMLKPAFDLYAKLGLDNEQYGLEILPFFGRYVGDPTYPWLLVAAKEYLSMCAETEYHREQMGLEMFFTFCYLGYLSTQNGSQFILPNHRDRDKSRLPQSDLVSLYLKSISILPNAFAGHLYEDEFVKHYQEFKEEEKLTNKDNWRGGIKALKAVQTVEKFCIWFRELLQELEKRGFGNEQFYDYFEEGYYGDGDDQYDEFDYVGAIYGAYGAFAPNLHEYYYQKIHGNLKQLYLAIGTQFNLKAHPLDANKVILEYTYRGQDIQEVTNPALHFCDARTTEYHHGVYYGLLMPVTTQDQSQLQVRIEYWFYFSQEKPKILSAKN